MDRFEGPSEALMLVWGGRQDVLNSDWGVGQMELGGNDDNGQRLDVWRVIAAVFAARAQGQLELHT